MRRGSRPVVVLAIGKSLLVSRDLAAALGLVLIGLVAGWFALVIFRHS